MKKMTDYQLALQVYEMFTSSKTIQEYRDKTKELSEQTNKTQKYLNSILEEYRNKFSKDQQQKIEQSKIIHKENQDTYIKVVEKLLQMDSEELKKYIKDKNIRNIKVFIARYIDKAKDIILIEQAKILLKKIEKIHTQKEELKKVKKTEEIYQETIKLHEIMIKEGFFDYVDFVRYYHKNMNMNEEDFYVFMAKHRKSFLRQEYPKQYEYYQNKLKENKIRTFIAYHREIQTMLNFIPDNYDIIDYYINIGMSIDVFRRLCNGILDEKQIVSLNVFFDKYLDRMTNKIKYPVWEKMTNETIIKGKLVTEETETNLLEFMNKHNIPTNYFVICFEKYKKGELDEYLDKKIKKD